MLALWRAAVDPGSSFGATADAETREIRGLMEAKLGADEAGEHMKGLNVRSWLEARRVVALKLMRRIAQLYALVKAKPDLAPWEYRAHQVLVQDAWVQPLRERLKGVEFDVSNRVVQQMIRWLKQAVLTDAPQFRRLVVVVDEIETGAALGDDSFHDSKRQGLLSPMSSTLAEITHPLRFVHVVFAGTASSFHRVEMLESAIGKFSSLNVVNPIPGVAADVLPTVTPDACAGSSRSSTWPTWWTRAAFKRRARSSTPSSPSTSVWSRTTQWRC